MVMLLIMFLVMVMVMMMYWGDIVKTNEEGMDFHIQVTVLVTLMMMFLVMMMVMMIYWLGRHCHEDKVNIMVMTELYKISWSAQKHFLGKFTQQIKWWRKLMAKTC